MRKKDYDAISNYDKRKLKDKKNRLPQWWLAVISYISFFVMLIVLALYVGKFGNYLSDNKGDWGTFGDYVGGVLNPLFGFFGFVALLYTIGVQNKQFSNSELTQGIQVFENLFTHMSSELAKIYDEFRKIKDTYYSDLIERRKILGSKGEPKSNWIFSDIESYLNEHSEKIQIIDITKELRSEFKAVRYFMYLYQILKFIDTSEYLDEKRKKLYSNLVRSSIENDILQLLFLNCFYLENYQDEFKDYHKLVTKFSFFEHMTFTHKGKLLPSFIYLSTLYKKEAFGKSNYYKELLIQLLRNKNLNYSRFGAVINSIQSIIKIDNDLAEISNFKGSERITFFFQRFEIDSKDFKTHSHSIGFESLTFKIESDKNLTLYLKVPANRFESFEVYLTDKENRYQFTKIENLPNMDTP